MITHAKAWVDAAPRWPRVASIILPAIVFAVVLCIAGIHYQGQTLARGPDQADMLLAFFNEASHAIAEEGLLAAMYTPGVRAGESNWSNPNYHMLYPLYFNWAGADASPAATLDRLNFIVLLHLALLGAGAYTLARALGVRVAPAIVVGLIIPWFPAVRSAAGWPHIIAGMAWLPWVLAAQIRLYRGSGWRRQAPAALLLAVAAAMLVHAHPAQNMVFAAWASGWIWFIVAVQTALARDRAGLHRLAETSAWMAASALAMLLICWPWLSEILAFHERSIRWLGEVGGFIVGNQPVPVSALRYHALPASDAGLVLSFEHRPGIGNAYLGAAVLVAALGVLSRGLPATPALRCARAMLACGLVALAFCFAVLAPLLTTIPLANKVRELTWWSCLVVLLMIPLAALGLQLLWARKPSSLLRNPWAWLGLVALVLASAATLASGVPYRVEALAALGMAFLAFAWSLRPQPGGARAFVLACALLLLATAWIPFRHNVRFAHDDAMLFHPDRVQAHADAAALAARLEGLDEYRFVLAGSVENAHLLTHAWTIHGFRSIHGGIGPTEHAKYLLLSQANPAVAALYGVRWSIWPQAAARPGDELLRPGLVLRTHPEALPRLFYLSGGLEVVENPVEYLRQLGDESPLRAVVGAVNLPDNLDAAGLHGLGRLTGKVDLNRNTRTILEATVETSEPGLLILNEDPAARWRATVGGQATPMFRVNGYQTALFIPAAGRHEVRIERPGRLWGGDGA